MSFSIVDSNGKRRTTAHASISLSWFFEAVDENERFVWQEIFADRETGWITAEKRFDDRWAAFLAASPLYSFHRAKDDEGSTFTVRGQATHISTLKRLLVEEGVSYQPMFNTVLLLNVPATEEAEDAS